MKESTTLTIKPHELLGMLSNYYTNKLNKPIAVKETHRVIEVGIYEDEEVDVDIYYEEEVEVLGHTAIKKVSLEKDDVKKILGELINEDYDIGYIYYKKKKKNNVFKGVVVSLNEKQKKLAKTPKESW